MIYAIISDVFANLEALSSVLEDASPMVDAFVCLGNAVGYGPDPSKCLTLVHQRCIAALAGPSERRILSRQLPTREPKTSTVAVNWTARALGLNHKTYLGNLPTATAFAPNLVAISPAKPATTSHAAARILRLASRRDPHLTCAFAGSSRSQLLWSLPPARGASTPSRYCGSLGRHQLTPGSRYLIDPGSVGRPRNEDPRAAYVVFDAENLILEFRRIPYDLDKTRAKVLAAGLPQRFAPRLNGISRKQYFSSATP